MDLAGVDLAALLMLIVIVESALLVLIPFRYFKPTARKLNSIIRRGRDLLLLVYDDGRVFLKEVEQISKHGILKGRKKDEYFIITSPSKSNPDPISAAAKELVDKRAILEDTGSCVFIGYAGKITATTPFVLGAAELANSPDVVKVEVPEGKQRLFLFSWNGLKKFLEEIAGVTAGGLMALILDIEQRVLAERRERFGTLKWFLYVLIGIFVIAIALKIMGYGG